MMAMLAGYDMLFALLFLLTGMCAGSFINVVIYRLPLMMCAPEDNRAISLAWPPSHCPLCHGRIRFYDNIPLLSWLVLRGRCRRCQGRIPRLYPLTEALTGLWFAGVYCFLAGPPATFLTLCGAAALLPPLVLFCLLYGMTLIDLRHYLIPDSLSYGLLWCGLLFSVCGLIQTSPFQAVLGGVVTYCLIRAAQWGYHAVRRHQGPGGGDVRLFAAAAAWVGLNQVPWLILLSAVAGGLLYGIKKTYPGAIPEPCGFAATDDQDICADKYSIPFAPAIALATLLLYLTRP